jgi:hypothetical protein
VKPEVKVMLLEALRSGKYAQGRRALLDNNTYCCLGVLCDLHAQATGKAWGCGPVGGIFRDTSHHYQGHTQMPSDDVYKWSGLSLADAQTLAQANDDGKSFEKIAKMIEEKL